MSKNKTKIVRIIGTIICVILIPTVIGLYGFVVFELFLPAKKIADYKKVPIATPNIERELCKCYYEYSASDKNRKRTIKAKAKIRFAKVDINKIQSKELQTFLRNVRGY